jgi:sodium/potassium/calcium exchanger 6
VTVSVEERANHESDNELQLDCEIVQSPEELPILTDESSDPDDWNRWLVIIQLFTAPLFMVLVIWASTNQDNPKALIRPTLISLLCSCVGLLLLLATTTAARTPRWRVLLCFLGFAVSISWISTIANEVVGVLKALGVILNISDAILGLTIFAVGNSCGDLVANITIAKLGWPVMALSACFGGPMLNILLGIGLSAMYLILTGASQRIHKHPGKKYKIKPYHIEVSKTLMISGVTLLATLLVLLILVPVRKWRMDRFIGWILIVLWLLSTAANVGVEMAGLTKSISL